MTTQPLSACQTHMRYMITDLLGDQGVKKFFKHVGLNVGDTLTLVNQINKHYIVYLKGSRYAMETAIADHIMVKSNG